MIHPDKVKSAIARATPDMFYTSKDTAAPTYAKYSYLGDGSSPKPGDDPNALANEPDVGSASVPYAATYGRTGNLYLAQRQVHPERLAPNTPILIWQIDKAARGALVVTLDGGVYWVDGVTAKQVRTLETAGELPAGTSKPSRTLVLRERHALPNCGAPVSRADSSRPLPPEEPREKPCTTRRCP